MNQTQYMLRAIELAERGVGLTNPNPMVGAVIVKDNQIIGEGWHKAYGGLHAEREALKDCRERGNDPAGAEIFVTLEPCCHHGKQPPCTEAILEAGIRKVYVGSDDPNPLVAGKGISWLREQGVEVVTGVEKERCDAINPVFFHYISTGLPYVVMKYAMTMDGKIATRTGASQWITGEQARARVHEDRHRYYGIMVGIQTVLKDDPMLTARIENGKNPVRIVCDSHLRIPEDSRIVQSAKEVSTIIATVGTGENRKDNLDYQSNVERLTAKGCKVIEVPDSTDHVNLRELMKILGEMKIDSILLEGGGTLNWSALEAGIVTKVQAYIAPKLFGGTDAKSPIGGEGVDIPANAFMLKNPVIRQIGEDYLIESEVDYSCSQG